MTTPPTTRPTNRKIDTNTLKLSGATNCTAIAPSDPATPVNIALNANVRVFSMARLMPIASAASAWSRIAIIARPIRPRTRFQRDDEQHACRSPG